MPLSSNDKRAELKIQCRKALSAHIHERLGLVVPPEDIRLRPSEERGYAWSFADSQQHLFEKELGYGTVGIFRSIMQQLGHSIEAISPQIVEVRSNQGEQSDGNIETRSDSFTATIQRLRCENLKFADELHQARAQLQQLAEQKEQWDTKNQALQEQLLSSQSRADQLEKELYNARGDIAGAIDILRNQQSRNSTSRKRMRNIQ